MRSVEVPAEHFLLLLLQIICFQYKVLSMGTRA